MADGEISYFDATSCPYGRTYGNWTVQWWRWLLSIPKSNNPALDTTGEYAMGCQKYSDIIFLAGRLATEETCLFNRSCTMLSGKSILFPVINCESNQLEQPELETVDDIIRHVKGDEDSIIRKECFVDDIKVPAQRVRSDPIMFDLEIVNDNIINVPGGGKTKASADGYWIFLKSLPVGKHTISFRGSCEYGLLNAGGQYCLNVC